MIIYELVLIIALIFAGASLVAVAVTKVLDRLLNRHGPSREVGVAAKRVCVAIIYLGAIGLSFEISGIGFHYFVFSSPYKNLVQFGLVILSALLISRILTSVLARSARRIGVEESVVRTANQVVSLVVYLASLVITFGIFNIQLQGLVTASGLVTAAVVFATGQIINNLVSGIFIATSKAFEVGDVIQIGADRGTVQKVSIRTTTILTEDGRNMVIPNMQFVTSAVINYTKVEHPNIRVAINFNVKRGSKDLEDVRSVLEETLKRYFIYPTVSDPSLHLRSITSAIYSFTAYVWVTEPSKIDRITDETLDRVKSALDAAGIEFA